MVIQLDDRVAKQAETLAMVQYFFEMLERENQCVLVQDTSLRQQSVEQDSQHLHDGVSLVLQIVKRQRCLWPNT